MQQNQTASAQIQQTKLIIQCNKGANAASQLNISNNSRMILNGICLNTLNNQQQTQQQTQQRLNIPLSNTTNNLNIQNDLIQIEQNFINSQSLNNSPGLSGNVSATAAAAAAAAAATRYKTELCRSFQENGTCKYGDKCQFAHGLAELRSMMRHPKYKTELCRTFHAAGYCPYGPRCHFVHDTSLEILSQAGLTRNMNSLNNQSNNGSSTSSLAHSPKQLNSLRSALTNSLPSLNSNNQASKSNKQNDALLTAAANVLALKLSNNNTSKGLNQQNSNGSPAESSSSTSPLSQKTNSSSLNYGFGLNDAKAANSTSLLMCANNDLQNKENKTELGFSSSGYLNLFNKTSDKLTNDTCLFSNSNDTFLQSLNSAIGPVRKDSTSSVSSGSSSSCSGSSKSSTRSSSSSCIESISNASCSSSTNISPPSSRSLSPDNALLIDTFDNIAFNNDYLINKLTNSRNNLFSNSFQPLNFRDNLDCFNENTLLNNYGNQTIDLLNNDPSTQLVNQILSNLNELCNNATSTGLQANNVSAFATNDISNNSSGDKLEQMNALHYLTLATSNLQLV